MEAANPVTTVVATNPADQMTNLQKKLGASDTHLNTPDILQRKKMTRNVATNPLGRAAGAAAAGARKERLRKRSLWSK